MRVVLVLFLALTAAANDVIDQQQTRVDAAADTLLIGGDAKSQTQLAQTVTAGVEGPLVAVRLPVACTSGTLIVEIKTVDGDRPGSTVLGSAKSSARGNRGFREIRLPKPIRMRAGQRFAIVLSNPTGTCRIAHPAKGNVYASGDAFEAKPNPPGWIPARDIYTWFDLPFQTIVARRRGV